MTERKREEQLGIEVTNIIEKRGKDTLTHLIRGGYCLRSSCDYYCPIKKTNVCDSNNFFKDIKSYGQSQAGQMLVERQRKAAIKVFIEKYGEEEIFEELL